MSSEEPSGKDYVVGEAEHFPGVARAHGMLDWLSLWTNATHGELRKTRGSPTILQAGDVVHLPPRGSGQVDKPVDGSYRFRVRATPLKLRVELRQQYAAPLGGTPARLLVDAADIEAPLDQAGGIAAVIAYAAQTGTLQLRQTRPAGAGRYALSTQLALHAGRLDPLDTSAGEYQRLRNLGYHVGDFEQADADALRSAVEEFQCEHGLAVDGVCGSQTRAKLKAVYGC